jgi:3-methylfumaryl-CoA hydratase
MSDWADWIGRTETRMDHVDPALVSRWLATLDRDEPLDGNVPQGLHWCLCIPNAPTASLGPDGHPARLDNPDSFMPPVPLPRRMWASSKVEFLSPLMSGMAIVRTSTVSSITEKSGASGPLAFVDVVHETIGDGAFVVRETQSIVYRDAAPALAPPSPSAHPPEPLDIASWDAHRMVRPTEPLLFRYSALTFNSHRIHYDLPYAREEEGYRGLVVHGPLTATLLLDLAQQQFGDNCLKTFSYRGLAPAIVGEDLHLVLRGTGQDIELGAFTSDGHPLMSAKAAV